MGAPKPHFESFRNKEKNPKNKEFKVDPEKTNSLAQEVEEAFSRNDFDTALEKLKELKRISSPEPLREEGAEFQEAREILGKDLIGPEEVKDVWGTEIGESELPPLPSREQIEKAKKLGEMLVLRIDLDPKEGLLTMERMNQMLTARFDKENKGKILYNTDWYKKEDFYTKAAPRPGWKFVSKETLAGSTDKDYVEQTRILRDHLDKNGLLTDKERDECSDKILDKLKITMSKDWESAAKTLSELEINKNHRRTPSEALYDSSIVLLSRGKKLLENNYDWTSVRSSGGWLVFVGPFGSDGLSVYYAKPGRSSSYLGVCPSR